MKMKTILEIKPAFLAALRAAGLADFDAMMRTPRAVQVTSHRHRETGRMELTVDGQNRAFFLKRVFRVPPKHAFWPLFRLRLGRSQPYREWHMLGELERAGIPAMRRVAYGERRRFGMPTSAFLLVEAAPMEHTLRDWLVPGFPKPATPIAHLRVRLAYGLGRLIGRLHCQGFSWPDLDAKHIFASPSPHKEHGLAWRFCLIDVERLTRLWHAGAKARRRPGEGPASIFADQLLDFRRSLSPLRISKVELLWFLAGYRSALREQASPLETDSTLTDLQLGGRKLSSGATDWLPRLPDGFEHPGAIPFVRRQADSSCIDARVENLLLPRKDAPLNELLDGAAARTMNKPGLEPHRRRVRLDFGEKAYYLKRYERPSLAAQFRRMWESAAKKSTAWREFHFIKRLGEIGVPTAKPIAFGETMAGPWERRSFLITEEINGVSLEKLVQEAAADPSRTPSWPQRREIIRQLAAITFELHAHKLFHRDLYLCHLFLTHNRDGGVVLSVIDLARMIEKPRRVMRWRIKDLAALNYSAPPPLVTSTDRMRFLKQYVLGHYLPFSGAPVCGGAGEATLRYIIPRIQARTLRMARHDASRAKRLQEKTKA